MNNSGTLHNTDNIFIKNARAPEHFLWPLTQNTRSITLVSNVYLATLKTLADRLTAKEKILIRPGRIPTLKVH